MLHYECEYPLSQLSSIEFGEAVDFFPKGHSGPLCTFELGDHYSCSRAGDGNYNATLIKLSEARIIRVLAEINATTPRSIQLGGV